MTARPRSRARRSIATHLRTNPGTSRKPYGQHSTASNPSVLNFHSAGLRNTPIHAFPFQAPCKNASHVAALELLLVRIGRKDDHASIGHSGFGILSNQP